MFRILSGAVAVFAMMMISMAVAPTAEAQIEVEKEVDRTSVPLVQAAKACSRVKYAFVCRDGNKGSGTAACRRGETEAKCCDRIKKTVAQACKPHGGLAKFKCACSRTKGGKRLAPGAQTRREPELSISNIGSSGQDGVHLSEPGKPVAKKICGKVKYAFVCRDGNRGSGTAACRRGETEAICCARIKKTVDGACRRHGGLGRFKCTCSAPGAARQRHPD